MEENERRITPWKIIKWTVLLLSFLVYAVVFVRLFASCDADISDDIILTTAEKADFEDLDREYELFNYQPTSWTSDDGTVQLKNIYYLKPISELQLTLSYRISAFGGEKDTTPFEFEIRVVENGETFEAEEGKPVYREDLPGDTLTGVELHSETRFDRKYIRICAPGIKIDDGVRRTEKVQTVDEDGNVSYITRTVIDGGNKVYLDIYDAETDELLYSFAAAGKGIGGARTRRNKVDVRIID